MDEKENTAPLHLGDYSDAFGFSPFKKEDLKSRSKSIGPGELRSAFDALRDSRQSSVGLPRGILPNREDEERKAARRKSMMNRRVSFAPEATLHTWDVIDHMRDHTTSTDDTQSTRRASTTEQPPADLDSPASQLSSEDDASADSGSEEEEELEDEEDATGTAMSFVSDADMTQQTGGSGGSSTSSSLDRNLKLAAETAGTRGIEYDEFGEMSMEFANEEITNAFQPWVQQETDERRGSAAYDQENMNPFVNKPLFQHSEQEEVTMDVTRAIGGIVAPSSPFNEVPMDITQPLSSIKSQFQFSPNKRARTEDTPASGPSPAKRARARYSLASNQTAQWDATMDFTQAVGGIRAGSEMSFDGNAELSMELTGVIGGISRQLENRQALPAGSSPFRIDVDETITRLGAEVQQEEAQSPTPRAKDSSVRRSSARLRRESMTEAHAEAELESSPTQRRSSRRLSAKSPGPQPESETTALIGMSTPVQALTNMQLSSVKQRSPGVAIKSPKSATKSPRTTPKSRRNAVKSPRQTTVTPPLRATATPPQPAPPSTPPAPVTASKFITDGIKLMLTPRKEFLKPVTPKKATPSPMKRPRSTIKSQPRLPDIAEDVAIEVADATQTRQRTSGIHLQDFLEQAGIRFMDLTTSKRRLTVATTPSRLRQMHPGEEVAEEISEITFEEAIVAAACLEPEFELYKHACSELKRYMDEGKADLKMLEAATYKETPLFVQAYMSAGVDQRAVLDAQMRDAKTHARLRSKEMWYAWRSNLIDELMKPLGAIAEDLVADDEKLGEKERLLAEVLPALQERRSEMQARVEELIAAVPRDEDKAELDAAREQLVSANAAMEEKRLRLEQLQEQMRLVEGQHEMLAAVSEECILTVRAAEQMRAEKESVSGDQTTQLKEAVASLESDYEWSIVAANANPPTVTMAYKSQLELFFHPGAFNRPEGSEHNAPISLKYVAKEEMSTTARFMLQALKAHLQIMPQGDTNISNMLALIASTWKAALLLVETTRLLEIEGPVRTAIVNDNCLSIESFVLLPAVKTKVKASFDVAIGLESCECAISVQTGVKVVYGEPYNEKNMTEFLSKHTDSGFETWPSAVQQLRRKLIERGPKTPQVKT